MNPRRSRVYRCDATTARDWSGRARTGVPAGVAPLRARGFTLVELLVVITIIGIILSFVMLAAMDAGNRANERATQALITKLESGLNDRLEALLETRPDYNFTHYYLGAIWNQAYSNAATQPVAGIARAQVIAWYDYIKAEMPDVFVVQSDTNYPLNFAGVSMPGSDNSGYLGAYANFVLPIGNSLQNNALNGLIGDGNQTNPGLGSMGSGIFGASYTAAAGIYKNIKAGGISYLPAGYDGIDNSASGSAGAGLVDEIGEGIPNASDQTTFTTALAITHKHSTARSEMLYAVLVEGRGPLGSVFNRDDFTDREVQDTDGDGLPEFVDAWGQPLQFFRWPILYHSDIQLGQVVSNAVPPPALAAPYTSVFQTREQDALDPNQQLMSPGWWFNTVNSNAPSGFTGVSNGLGMVSNGVLAFESFFHRLSEPFPYSSSFSATYWDRSQTTKPQYGSRRAFYSKFLIVSSGPDQTSGIFRYPDIPASPPSAAQLIANENNAMPFSIYDLVDFTSSSTIPSTNVNSSNMIPVTSNPSIDPSTPTTSDLINAAQDDISNQNIMANGSIGGSG
jgi:prepilin-type N-terminal cleavage/methylation domain-containing protein